MRARGAAGDHVADLVRAHVAEAAQPERIGHEGGPTTLVAGGRRQLGQPLLRLERPGIPHRDGGGQGRQPRLVLAQLAFGAGQCRRDRSKERHATDAGGPRGAAQVTDRSLRPSTLRRARAAAHFGMTSLRLRLLLLVAVVLVPSFVLLLVLVGRERAVRLEVAQATASRYVDLGVQAQEEAIADGQRLLRAFGMLQTLRDGPSEACQRTLATLSDMVEEAWSLSRTLPDGTQDCATRGTATLPRSVAGNPTFQALRRGEDVGVGSYITSSVTGELLLPINVPMRDPDGAFLGVLSTGLRVRWIDRLVSALAATPGAVVTVSGPEGVVLRRAPALEAPGPEPVRTPIAAAMQARGRGVLDAVGVDGVRRVWAFDRLQSPDSAAVFLSVGLPADAVYAGVTTVLRRLLVALAVWLALMVALAWWATDRFVLRDVRALVQATERLGGGDLTVRTGRTRGTGELSRLSAAFDDMAARLEERQARDLQAQKLESIGQLAGGVAHDFNNLLTAIIGNAELARDALPAGHAARGDLDATLDAAERSATLTRQLLSFARRSDLSPRIVRVDDLLQGVAGLLRRVLGERVTVTVRTTPELRLARLDSSAVEQAIVNLAVNARDAMPDGGVITVSAANQAVEAGDGDAARGVPPGEWIRIDVRDAGVGMTPEVKRRAFEPFFTTKPVGEGTGLGLAMVYGTVAQHDGHVLVDSTPGLGTTVSLFLPPAPIGSTPTPLQAAAVAPPRPEARTVLLVEDEDAVRRVIERVLRDRGFRVVTASDGEVALARCDAELLDGLSLVITDVVMPRVDGPQLVSALRAQRPALPVLFVSGYRESHVLDDLLEHADTRFIAKPFTTSGLLAAIDALVAERDSGRGVRSGTASA